MRTNSSDSGPGTDGDRAVERLLEAEAGLDADGEQVEDVGQLDADLVLPLGHPPVEDRLRSQERRQPPAARRRRTPPMPSKGRTKNTSTNHTGMSARNSTRIGEEAVERVRAGAARTGSACGGRDSTRREAPAQVGESGRRTGAMARSRNGVEQLACRGRSRPRSCRAGAARPGWWPSPRASDEHAVEQQAQGGSLRPRDGEQCIHARASDLDLDRLLHPVEADEGEQTGADQHDVADRCA